MNVYQKLLSARLNLQNTELKKSGNNKFAGYKYFELGDFLPVVQTIFAEHDLIGVVSFGTTEATLTITDMDKPEDKIVISSPMSTAALKGCHEVQNLGAVQTYLRRYLWVTAMEIVEHDALDSSEPLKPETKKVANKGMEDKWGAITKPEAPAKKTVEGNGGNWNIKISDERDGNGWPAAAVQGAEMALGMASGADDVLEIFKTNRVIFEKLQQEDPEKYTGLMEKFKSTKESFK